MFPAGHYFGNETLKLNSGQKNIKIKFRLTFFNLG